MIKNMNMRINKFKFRKETMKEKSMGKFVMNECKGNDR